MHKTRVYSIWHGIKQRCSNPNNHAFKDYGARGIKICERWLDFNNFFADMGEPPVKLTIERIDNNGNYEKSNCCWATRQKQSTNRRGNKFLTYNGITKTATEWGRDMGIASQTIFQRMSLGWPIEKILSTEKHLDLEGLKMGGMGNAIAQRAKTHCKNGHPFDEANTAWYKGTRACRRCHANRQAGRMAKIPKR